jgi:hypothetical protein
LAWRDGPGPGYDADEARDAIRRRYENSLPPIRHTLRRLVENPRFCDLVAKLREEGWKDWHILQTLANAVSNERLNLTLAPDAWGPEIAPAMRRLMNEEETSEESEKLPDSFFSEDNLRTHLMMSNTLFANYWGLEVRQRTPDFPALERLLTERYGFKDDVEHDPVFGPCDAT